MPRCSHGLHGYGYIDIYTTCKCIRMCVSTHPNREDATVKVAKEEHQNVTILTNTEHLNKNE